MAATTSKCEAQTTAQIVKTLAAQAVSALMRAICRQFKALISVVISLLQVEATVVVPVLELGSIFVENFIVFPLSAVNSTLASLDSTSQSLTDAGLDRSCQKFATLHETIDRATGRVHSLHQDLTNLVDTSQRWVDDIHDYEAKVQDTIESMGNLNNKIQCQ